jgi:NAD(P)-dependent dehydrogenase (short-subunit alcohol dehydrogenase family)
VLSGRSPEKLARTTDRIAEELPGADLHELVVDLADLSSVRRAAEEGQRFGPVDVLVNNAGVMATPEQRTVDGLDLQMATNHFGPFLLTGLLLPQLAKAEAGRVVTVSSLMHRFAGSAPVDDPRQPSGGIYRRWRVYSQSKLANLYFTYELDHRARAAGLTLRALAAHPGYAATHLIANGQVGRASGGMANILNGVARATAQSAQAGALPVLMAATAELDGGASVGPGGFQELGGRPKVVRSTRLSRDEQAAARLWQISEDTTGIRYP